MTLIEQDSVFNFNDKNSITADPFDSRYVYTIWDRSRFPSDKRELHSVAGFPRSIRSDAMPPHHRRRADLGGARAIFQPQANQFGIGHQIVVLSDGTLVDSFMLSTGPGRTRRARRSR